MELNLEEIKARLAAATAPPWEFQDLAEDGHPSVWWVDSTATGSKIVAEVTPEGCEVIWHREDAEFIAHARQDVPALVAEVERLCAALTEAEAR